jgi:hypothetical protein
MSTLCPFSDETIRTTRMNSTVSISDYIVSNARTIGKNLEGSDGGLVEVPSCNLPGGTEESHKTSVITPGVPDKIQTEFPNSSQELYCYTNLLATERNETNILCPTHFYIKSHGF